MPPKVAGRNSSEIELDSIGTPTYDKLDKFLDASCSAGTFEGGAISDAGSGQISIASAKGVIRTSNSDVGNLVAFDIAATTPVSLTDNSINYIYISYNSGSPVYAVTTTYADIDLQSEVIIARVYRIGTKLWLGNFGQKIQDTPLRDLYRLQTLRRFEHASGDVISTPSLKYIALSAGVYFANYEKITTASVDTSGAGRFDTWYRNGVGGWTRTVDQASIDNGNWDDGTGTLNSLDGVNHYGVHWVYRCVDGTVHVQYGQASYTSLAAAQSSTVPTVVPPLTQTLCVLVGRVIIKNAAASLTEVASTWTTVFESGNPTGHNDLSGLDGGTSGEYYHLSLTNYTDLTDAGDTALHYHSTDRNPANLSAAVPINKGGTGLTPTPANGTLFIGKTDASLASTTLTEGTNVHITNGNGSITIASTLEHIDGGSATSTYLASQVVDCGGAT
jgi:hypothetical protein